MSTESIFFWNTEIEKLLNEVGKSLKDYPTMPFPPDQYLFGLGNTLIYEERSYDSAEMRAIHDRGYPNLNAEQLDVYKEVVDSVNQGNGGLFFVYGSGGCGKTFLWNILCSRFRSEGKIVLPVASSGIAATLLPGGRTAHSRFQIPIKLDQYSVAGIKHGSDIAELIKQTSLVIWDEAPMQHRHAFEAVDRAFRDIMSSVDSRRSQIPFGGITIVFGGDFRQILPVIPKAPRGEVVNASFNQSKLWDFCKVYLLHQNMRLRSATTPEQKEKIKEFSNWVLDIGSGNVDNIHPEQILADPEIIIPEKYLIRDFVNPVRTIVEDTYPQFVENMKSPEYLRSRAILTPTNSIVDDINSHVLGLIPGQMHTFLSQDSIDDIYGDSEDDYESSFPVEYLNSINMPCIPKHELNLKVGAVVMLMRNLNQIMGLCNGTRMILTKCLKNSVECQILTGSHVGSKHLIPRIEMEPSDTHFPFVFKRIQFPLQVCFAMTINKSQGQSLDRVGLYLPQPVFSHGQLYVAVSRVTSPEGLRILIVADSGRPASFTANVVFDEVFYNLPDIHDTLS